MLSPAFKDSFIHFNSVYITLQNLKSKPLPGSWIWQPVSTGMTKNAHYYWPVVKFS